MSINEQGLFALKSSQIFISLQIYTGLVQEKDSRLCTNIKAKQKPLFLIMNIFIAENFLVCLKGRKS